MAQRKKAATDAGSVPSTPVRPGDADGAGGSDGAAYGAELAVKLLVKELRRLDKAPAALDAETGQLVALYARTLSAIDNAQARRGTGRGEFGTMTTEELLVMAMEDPTLRDALRRLGK